MGDDLEKRIADAQAKLEARERPSDAMRSAKGAGVGMKMATDFVAAILVGAGLGWGADKMFGSAPWGLVICLLLGFAAGVRNAVQTAMNAGRPDADTGLDETPEAAEETERGRQE